jgi:hypothetical protein
VHTKGKKLANPKLQTVIPTQAGIQIERLLLFPRIPTCAEMTIEMKH